MKKYAIDNNLYLNKKMIVIKFLKLIEKTFKKTINSIYYKVI
jgi:hypothetical protein